MKPKTQHQPNLPRTRHHPCQDHSGTKHQYHTLTAFNLSTFFFSGTAMVAASTSSPLNSL